MSHVLLAGKPDSRELKDGNFDLERYQKNQIFCHETALTFDPRELSRRYLEDKVSSIHHTTSSRRCSVTSTS
jgi:hypothetical protein